MPRASCSNATDELKDDRNAAGHVLAILAEERLRSVQVQCAALADERTRALQGMAAAEVQCSALEAKSHREARQFDEEKAMLSAAARASSQRSLELEQEISAAHTKHGTLETQLHLMTSEMRSFQMKWMRSKEDEAMLVARAEVAEGVAGELRCARDKLLEERASLQNDLAMARALSSERGETSRRAPGLLAVEQEDRRRCHLSSSGAGQLL